MDNTLFITAEKLVFRVFLLHSIIANIKEKSKEFLIFSQERENIDFFPQKTLILPLCCVIIFRLKIRTKEVLRFD
jgi:hypothetical protein